MTYAFGLFSCPGIDVLDINCDGVAQARNVLLRRMDRLTQQGAQQRVVECLLLVAKPAFTRHYRFHIKSMALGWVRNGVRAQFHDQQWMLDQNRRRSVTQAFCSHNLTGRALT